MNKIKAELKYKANSFEIIKEGDYVICSVSSRIIPIKNLNYWNVDLQEAYFSPLEAQQRFEQLKKNKK